MLSNDEFIKSVENIFYPKATEIEQECLRLFNKQFIPSRGPTGLQGLNEIDFTIGLLQSSINFLKALAKEQNIKINVD
jgi:hypothetical protein